MSEHFSWLDMDMARGKSAPLWPLACSRSSDSRSFPLSATAENGINVEHHSSLFSPFPSLPFSPSFSAPRVIIISVISAARARMQFPFHAHHEQGADIWYWARVGHGWKLGRRVWWIDVCLPWSYLGQLCQLVGHFPYKDDKLKKNGCNANMSWSYY